MSGAAAGYVPGRHAIEAYGRGGFRFAGMSHRGSILLLPSGVSAWPLTGAHEIASSAFDRVFDEAPPLEFLVVGTGAEFAVICEAIRGRFRAAAISLDAMQTGPAARTYNVLLAESRRVGAALIAVP